MNENDEVKELVVKETVALGSMNMDGPREVVQRATVIANELANIIKDKNLFSTIQGRRYVQVEGWTTMGAMLGVTPREVYSKELEDGSYEACVELVRVSDQAVIGRASAICGTGEFDRSGNETWMNRPPYARKSMAITRATSKAFRLAFSWIMALAGYEVTPAEEMDGVIVEGEIVEASTVQKMPQQAPKRATQPAKANSGTLTVEKLWDMAAKRRAENDGAMTPEALKGFLAHMTNVYEGRTATDKQLGLLRGLLGKFFLDDIERHAWTEWLFGVQSTNDLTGPQVYALMEWIKPEKDSETNSYAPDMTALNESKLSLRQAMIDSGQLEMEIDNGD